MTLDQTNHLRNLFGKLGAFFCIVFLVAAVDGLVLHFRQPENIFHLLRGESVKVNGSLRGDVNDIGELTYVSPSDRIQVAFEDIHAGFWLGGKMWRGLLTVSPDQEPGKFRVSVNLKGDNSPRATTVFYVHVYNDSESMRKDAKSFIHRYLNISPWLVFAAFLPLTLLTFAFVFYLSHRRERLLLERGIADVYHIARKESEYEIAFGMGTLHGIEPGATLTLLDKEGNPIRNITVKGCSMTDAVATVDLDCAVQPGFMVSRND